MTRYVVRAVRWEHLWELHVDGVGVTQARNLTEAPALAADYIAARLDVPPAAVEVTVTPDVGAEIAAAAAAARHLRQNGEDLVSRAAAANRALAGRLVRDLGLSQRDAATYLGVTPARVSQLLGA